MAQFQRHFVQDLTKPLIVRQCGDLGFTGDNLSDVISVDLYTDGVAYSGGGTCAGACICPDGSTVALTGSVSGKTASVTLKEDCFAIPGQIGIGIRITTGTTKTTVLKCIYNVDLFATNNPVDPGSRIALDVGDLINRIDAAVESIPASADQLKAAMAPNFSATTAYPAGAYVWYNGTLYRFTAVHAAGSWTGTDATAVALGNDVADLKSAITEHTLNLFDIYLLNVADGITVSDNVMSGTASAFATAYGNNTNGITTSISFEQNTQYTISLLAKNRTGSTGQGLIIRFKYTDDSQSQFSIGNAVTDYTAFEKSSDNGKTVSKIIISYASESGLIWDLKNIQIEKGSSATEYISPLTAVDIYARDQINDCAKLEYVDDQFVVMNAVDVSRLNKSEQTKKGVTCIMTSGVLSADGTADGDTYFDLYTGNILGAGLAAGKTYYVNTGLRNIDADGYLAIYFNRGSGNVLAYDSMVGTFNMKIPSDAVSIIIRYYINNGTTVNVSTRITVSEALSNAMLTNSAEIRFLRAYNIGDCTIIKFKDGTSLVIDFGINEDQHILLTSWNSAISELGITHIDYAIISHYHSDHCGMILYGISSLIDENTTFFLPNGHAFTTAELEALAWVDERTDDDIVDTYTDVMTALTTAGCKLIYPSENDVWWIGGAEIKFWNANMSDYMTAYANHTAYDYNDCSLCNYLTIGSQRIAFTGDASKTVCEKYKTSVLQCQILKAMHHAVGYDIVPKFMSSVMPNVSVTMLGYNLCHSRFGTSKYQEWCEDNFVPNVATGINEKTLSLKLTDRGYYWNTSCRRCINADEEITGA